MSGSDVIIVAIIAFVFGAVFGNWVSRTALTESCEIQKEFRIDARVFDCLERAK